MKWQPKSDGFIIALWGLFTPFYPPLCRPKLHSENTTVLSNPHPYGSTDDFVLLDEEEYDWKITKICMPPEIFRAQWKLRHADRLHGWSNQNCQCGYPRGWAVGGFFSTEVIEDELYRAYWTDSQLTERDLSDAHLLHVYKQAHSIVDTVVWTGEGFLPTGRTRISAYLWTVKLVVIPHYGSCHIFFLSRRLPFLFLFKSFACEDASLSPIIIGSHSSRWWIVMHTYLRDSEEIGFAHWQAARMRIWGQFSKAYSTWVRKLGKFANFPQSIQNTPSLFFHTFEKYIFTSRSCPSISLPILCWYFAHSVSFKHVFSAWNWVIVLRVYDGSVLSQEVLTSRLCKLIPGLTKLVPEAKLEWKRKKSRKYRYRFWSAGSTLIIHSSAVALIGKAVWFQAPMLNQWIKNLRECDERGEPRSRC